MQPGALGKVYEDGELIVGQGEVGNCMYVVQEGHLEVWQEREGGPMSLGTLGRGDFFGEMAIFEHEPRVASVKAVGRVRVLTVDKKTLLRRMQEDPTLAFRLVEQLSKRVRDMNAKLAAGR